jgi:hypothetical protein
VLCLVNGIINSPYTATSWLMCIAFQIKLQLKLLKQRIPAGLLASDDVHDKDVLIDKRKMKMMKMVRNLQNFFYSNISSTRPNSIILDVEYNLACDYGSGSSSCSIVSGYLGRHLALSRDPCHRVCAKSGMCTEASILGYVVL